MMKKSLWIVLIACLLCLALALSGCGKKDKNADAARIPEGVYVDTVAGRGMLFVTAAEKDALSFRVEWANSAASQTRWEMTGVYDSAKNAFVYSDGVRIDVSYDEQERESESLIYSRGTGSFVLMNDKLIWTNDKEPDNSATSFVYSMSMEDYKKAQAEEPPTKPEVVVVAPTPASEPTPAPETPAPEPTVAPSPTPVPPGGPIITKHPTDETVKEGGSCLFVAKYHDAIWAVWHFVSPDGQTDLPYDSINTLFPTLEVINGEYSTMKLNNIPLELSGWRVYCRYSNKDYSISADTNMALITVQPAA